MLSEDEFRDYVVSKGLDVIGGDYKRYLYRCVEHQDEWALKIHASITKVNALIKEIHFLVERVRAMNTPLSRVCKEIVTAMHAPLRRVSVLQLCCLTGSHSTNCIDVSRAAKTEHPVVVHESFEYFVVMLYFVHRLEHVVRSMVKSWIAKQSDDLDLGTLSTLFQDETALFHGMWERFIEGYSHVYKSLEAYVTNANEQVLAVHSEKRD